MPQAHPGHIQDLAWKTWTELCYPEHPGNATALMAGKEMWVLPLSSKGSEAIRWRSQTREQAHSLHVPLLCHSKEFKPWRFCLFLLFFFLLAVIVRNDVNRYIVKYAPFALLYFFFFCWLLRHYKHRNILSIQHRLTLLFYLQSISLWLYLLKLQAMYQRSAERKH